MAIDTQHVTAEQLKSLFSRGESHFLDFKAKAISPTKLMKTLSAFANAEGGELYVGIAESSPGCFRWDGFQKIEDANGHLQALENVFPLGACYRYTFLASPPNIGYVLKIEIDKVSDVKTSSDGIAYLRRGAQSLPQTTPEQLERLRYSKGVTSFEDQLINTDAVAIENSVSMIEFALDIIPSSEPSVWLRKQRLIVGDRPAVAGVILFADEPQADIPKASIKIYRYKTTAALGTRETLDFDPIAIEGNAYQQIYAAVAKTKEITESIPIEGGAGLEKIEYPTEAIHEIITNAVIHRDYSVNDDIHVRIFDNRIEVASPGSLPAHITSQNILEERFARNPRIVRLLNKFRNPPNKDVGEGLNTAFELMRKLKLKDPIVLQKENSVLVTLRHEKLSSPQQIIIDYLRENAEINNSIVRDICHIGSENTVKRLFTKMVESEVLERVPNRPLNKTGYVKGPKFPKAASE